MIATIRILRRKCHDIECIYVLEFLKLIGCFVFDRVFSNELSEDINKIMSEEELIENYDENICYGVLEDKISEFGMTSFKYIKPGESDDSKTNAENFLCELVEKLWFDYESLDDMIVRSIMELYNKEKIFTYLYNKGNLKFVCEYNSDGNKNSNERIVKNLKENMYEHTYSALLKFYKKLIDKDSSEIEDSVYLKFAKINLAQDLNETRELMGEGRMFRADYMLKTLGCIENYFPSMIRCYYLAGIICNYSNRYLVDSFSYYLKAESRAVENNLPRPLLGLIYYQMGKCLEKKRRGDSLAYEAYLKAYRCNPYMMRALYKLAEIEYERGTYEKAIKDANEIIRILLNGYSMNEAMPGQQLYAYKSMVLLGNVYEAKGRHELAIRCYRQAIRLAKTKSRFYDVWDGDGILFESVQKLCMPVQPIYYRMINCAAMCNNLNQSAEYYRMLREENE